MNSKDNSILKVIKIIKNTFGDKIFKEVDYWDSKFSIGLQKENKLIYISTSAALGDEDFYFYECEDLVNDSEKIYTSAGSDNCNSQQLLNVIEKFFLVKRV